MSGYSKTPLAKKLGIKAKDKIKLINEPEHYFDLFTDLPEDLSFAPTKHKKNLIHFFTTRSDELIRILPQLKNEIVPNGIIWVSWPKKAAKTVTDVNENMIRDVAIKNSLVDVKVCAVDDTWSGLKLVIPLKDRKI